MSNTREGMVIHHTVTPQSQSFDEAQQSINNSHRSRLFPLSTKGFYIGYHYMIHPNGEFRQYREDFESGAHTAEQTGNFRFIGVALIGNFEHDNITDPQYNTLITLSKSLANRYNWSHRNIHYHGMFKATACPGNNIKNQFQKIKNDIFRTEENRVSSWAQEAVGKATRLNIATDWSDPQEIVGTSTLEWIFKNLGFIDEVQGGITKERLIVALDRAKLLEENN